ncbi:Hypothetical predicted protein [Marmota monax]|uniref:Uncharacterized protein n=1 Tax=Marmota monax TaxID=9995 RepID=A0A5E4D4B1_MARMO|nr:Hypothetical predicted protein [Marmota monax]
MVCVIVMRGASGSRKHSGRICGADDCSTGSSPRTGGRRAAPHFWTLWRAELDSRWPPVVDTSPVTPRGMVNVDTPEAPVRLELCA